MRKGCWGGNKMNEGVKENMGDEWKSGDVWQQRNGHSDMPNNAVPNIPGEFMWC